MVLVSFVSQASRLRRRTTGFASLSRAPLQRRGDGNEFYEKSPASLDNSGAEKQVERTPTFLYSQMSVFELGRQRDVIGTPPEGRRGALPRRPRNLLPEVVN